MSRWAWVVKHFESQNFKGRICGWSLLNRFFNIRLVSMIGKKEIYIKNCNQNLWMTYKYYYKMRNFQTWMSNWRMYFIQLFTKKKCHICSLRKAEVKRNFNVSYLCGYKLNFRFDMSHITKWSAVFHIKKLCL